MVKKGFYVILEDTILEEVRRVYRDKSNQKYFVREEGGFCILPFGTMLRSFFIFSFLLLTVNLATPFAVQAETGWISREDGWYYFLPSGEEDYSGWIRPEDSERWYYLANGKMQTGWISWKGKWYFLHADGAMAEKQWVGNFYIGGDGAALMNTESPDGWRLSENGSYLLKGRPTEELNEKTAKYIKVLMEYPNARAVFGSPSQLVLENGNAYPFIIFKKMSLYDPKTSALLYEGDAGFHRNAVLEYFDGKEIQLIHPMDLMQNHYISAKQVSIDPAGFITYVAGEKR